jgi:hypothetical protein
MSKNIFLFLFLSVAASSFAQSTTDIAASARLKVIVSGLTSEVEVYSQSGYSFGGPGQWGSGQTVYNRTSKEFGLGSFEFSASGTGNAIRTLEGPGTNGSLFEAGNFLDLWLHNAGSTPLHVKWNWEAEISCASAYYADPVFGQDFIDQYVNAFSSATAYFGSYINPGGGGISTVSENNVPGVPKTVSGVIEYDFLPGAYEHLQYGMQMNGYAAASAVPEPQGYVALGLGLVSLGFRRRRAR